MTGFKKNKTQQRNEKKKKVVISRRISSFTVDQGRCLTVSLSPEIVCLV